MANELLDNLRRLVEEENYEEAAVLLPKIKEQKAKTSSELLALAKTYGKLGEFEKSYRYFNKAYKVRPSKLLYKDMIEMCIDCGQLSAAEKHYEEYRRMANNDTYNILLLKYKILKLGEAHRLQLIDALIALNDCKYTEVYAYELAKQLHKAGMSEECLAECKRICESFDESPITQKAATLYAFYSGELSAEDIKDAAQMLKDQDAEIKKARLEKETGISELDMIPMMPEADYDEEEADLGVQLISEAVQNIIAEDAQANQEEILDTEAIEEAAYEEMAKEEAAYEEMAKEEAVCEEMAKEEEAVCEERTEEEEAFEETLEEGMKQSLKYTQMEMSAPHYQTFELQKDFSLGDLRNGRVKRIIESKGIKVDEILGNFARMEEVNKSALKAVELAANQREKVCMVITGERGSGKTTLGIRMIRLMCKMGVLKYDRVAKIDGEMLNAVNLSERRAQLLRYNILVENAGMLDAETLEELITEFGDVRSGTCIILEDNMRNVTQLLRSKDDFTVKFNNRIHLPKYTENELMGFACDILGEEDYELEKEAANMLMAHFASLPNNKKTVSYVADYMKKVVTKADKRLSPKILDMAYAGDYDEIVELVVLQEDLTL